MANDAKDNIIPIRRPRFPWKSAPLPPRAWVNDDIVLSHAFNAFSVMLPKFEFFAAEVIGEVLPHITDERIKRNAQSYIGQEVQHARVHKQSFEILNAMGYDVAAATRCIQRFNCNLIRRYFGLKCAIAFIAGFEHMTLILARRIYERQILLSESNTLQTLFRWHLAEEVEHRGVAFDIAENYCRGWIYRIVGIFFATLMVYGQFFLGIFVFFQQEKISSKLSTWLQLVHHFLRYFPNVREQFWDFLPPRFHPDKYVDTALVDDAKNYLRTMSTGHKAHGA